MIINPYIFGGGIDPDAQAFITAASITDATQKTAINNLVVSLKGYGIWTKMKALYPFVGGTASQHKFNLKDPRDLDAAFRLVFSGGWTHNSNGVTPNGTNGYADTRLNEDSVLTLNNEHISIYSRTNSDGLFCDIGLNISSTQESTIFAKYSNIFYPRIQNTNNGIANTGTSQGLFVSNRTNSTQIRAFQNGVLKLISNNSVSKSSYNFTIGALNRNVGITFYSNRNYAFASIGDGLSDTEAANFYTAVQAFQVTLGRSIGTQTVSDADAQAFVTNANIQDQVQATAINNLVIGLKADSLWTKMKAIYPFVGGDATSHKFNLKDPQDTDAAYRLVFNGGWTHSSTGATPNGTNGYADTKFTPSIFYSVNTPHLSVYSRTDTIGGDKQEIGSVSSPGTAPEASLLIKYTSNIAYPILGGIQFPSISNTDSRGFYIANRKNTTNVELFKNNSKIINSAQFYNTSNVSIYIGARNNNNTGAQRYSDRQLAFSSIGDGLSDTEAANFYTRVNNFQIALDRNV